MVIVIAKSDNDDDDGDNDKHSDKEVNGNYYGMRNHADGIHGQRLR